MKKTTLLTVLLLGAAISLASAAEPKENWEKSCLKCHGADGKGATKMGAKLNIKDLTDAKVQAGFKDEEATKAIKEGIKAKDDSV